MAGGRRSEHATHAPATTPVGVAATRPATSSTAARTTAGVPRGSLARRSESEGLAQAQIQTDGSRTASIVSRHQDLVRRRVGIEQAIASCYYAGFVGIGSKTRAPVE